MGFASPEGKVVEELLTALAKIQQSINSLSGSLWAKYHDLYPDSMRVYEPRVDIEDQGSYLVLYMDMPGFRKNEIKILITEDFVEVKAEKSEERVKEEDSRKYLQRERIYRRAYKRVELPAKVRTDNARARLEDGVLTIYLPKSGERREVEVRVE
ncbi:MAG: Hsp20/alpha crystallin family protein [Thermofilaceae archaeon]|jgi:HSP20 family protein